MNKKQLDKNGVPFKITLPVYYGFDDNGDILYDIEEMENQLAEAIDGLPKFKIKKTYCKVCGSLEDRHYCSNVNCKEFIKQFPF